MKTIFRYINTTALVAVIALFGVAAGFAQNPCEDAAAIAALDAKFRENYNKPDLATRKTAIEAGKQYIEKYSSCGEATADVVTWLKGALPKMEEKVRAEEARMGQQALYTRFDAAVKASNFDDVYAAGRDILAKEPEQLDLLIALGSIGYDESFKNNFKYNDETLKYARQAIAALEAGKPAKTYGLFGWTFKDKATALSELNLTIGYITQVAQKNKKDAVPYLYKATQGGTSTAKNPIPYELVGWYYFDELNKLVQQIKAAEATQSASDTVEVAQKKVDDIKALVALANGTAERAMDAFSRAYALADPKNAPYRTKLKKNVEDAYKLRFGKVDGVDAYIAGVPAKPFPNPTSPITPVSDPEPVKTGAGTAVAATPAAPTPVVTKPVAETAAPAATTKAVPAKAAATAKAKAKKPVVKKGI